MKCALLSNSNIELLSRRVDARHEMFIGEGYGSWIQESAGELNEGTGHNIVLLTGKVSNVPPPAIALIAPAANAAHSMASTGKRDMDSGLRSSDFDSLTQICFSKRSAALKTKAPRPKTSTESRTRSEL